MISWDPLQTVWVKVLWQGAALSHSVFPEMLSPGIYKEGKYCSYPTCSSTVFHIKCSQMNEGWDWKHRWEEKFSTCTGERMLKKNHCWAWCCSWRLINIRSSKGAQKSGNYLREQQGTQQNPVIAWYTQVLEYVLLCSKLQHPQRDILAL